MTWKSMVKKESIKIGLKDDDAMDRKTWRVGVVSWSKSQWPIITRNTDYNKW